MKQILLLNGPNLNMLGTRQPDVYGHTTLSDVERDTTTLGVELGAMVTCKQSNYEGQLVDWIQEARETMDGIIINPGAYTHTSVALMDAVSSIEIPTIELHLSNIHAREEFRHTSYIAKVALGIICGFGAHGYVLALEAMAQHLKARA